ncbi:Reverse transcriptase Ty1/copia-type domain-containing protein [Camponotus japonicus]
MLKELEAGNKVCKLNKALYGLRQAGRRWYVKLNEELKQFGLNRSNIDPCIYHMNQGEDLLLVAIYVDDLLVVSWNDTLIAGLAKYLSKKFEVRDLGRAKYCLGIEFSHEESGIKMNQKGYINDILKRFGMVDSRPVSTPIDLGLKLKRIETQTAEERNLPYRKLIGSLMYLAICTRPDIAYAVSYLSQYNSCFNKTHWVAAKRILRYLKGTSDLGLHFRKDSNSLKGYCDADWGNCLEDRRSYTGYVFVLAGSPIAWESRKQRTVALSSTEAEYMAMTEATKEAICTRKFLIELNFDTLADVTVLSDNNGAQKLAENPMFHNRTKHIDIRHHFVREALENDLLKIQHVSTNDMAADILTKGLSRPKHLKCIEQLGLDGIKINS